jgi:hypothetical protein
VKLRIYTDTSVLAGCEDEERWAAEHSVRLLETLVQGERVLIRLFAVAGRSGPRRNAPAWAVPDIEFGRT